MKSFALALLAACAFAQGGNPWGAAPSSSQQQYPPKNSYNSYGPPTYQHQQQQQPKTYNNNSFGPISSPFASGGSKPTAPYFGQGSSPRGSSFAFKAPSAPTSGFKQFGPPPSAGSFSNKPYGGGAPSNPWAAASPSKGGYGGSNPWGGLPLPQQNSNNPYAPKAPVPQQNPYAPKAPLPSFKVPSSSYPSSYPSYTPTPNGVSEFDELKMQIEMLSQQLGQLKHASYGSYSADPRPQTNFFWVNREVLTLDGQLFNTDGKDVAQDVSIDDILMEFCVPAFSLLEVDAQVTVNLQDLYDAGYTDVDVVLSLTKNMNRNGVVKSRAKSEGLIESMSLVYSEFVYEPTNFTLLLVNLSDQPVSVNQGEAQARVKIFADKQRTLDQKLPDMCPVIEN